MQTYIVWRHVVRNDLGILTEKHLHRVIIANPPPKAD